MSVCVQSAFCCRLEIQTLEFLKIAFSLSENKRPIAVDTEIEALEFDADNGG